MPTPDLLDPALVLQQLTHWSTRDEGRAIGRRLSFGDFPAAFAFMTRMAFYSERVDHHPEWFNVHRTLDIRLSTHDAGGVTQRDVAWALEADRLFAKEA